MGDTEPTEKPKTVDKTPLRPINNQALAAMLRESANIVERGQFDPILYTALQDFRAYYKLNYPKKKGEKSGGSTSREKRRSSKKQASEGSNEGPDTAETADDAAAAETEPLSRQSSAVGDGARIPPHVPKARSFAESQGNSMRGREAFEQETTPEQPSAPNPTESNPVSSNHVSRPAKEPVVVEAVPVPPAPPTTDYHMEPSPSNTIQKAVSPNIFGKLKFPKVNVHLPTAAFAATSKKNAERAKEDLHIFNGILAQQAEASERRKAPSESQAHPAGRSEVPSNSTHSTNHAPTSQPLPNSSQAEHAPATTSRDAGENDGNAARVTELRETSSLGTVDSSAAVRPNPTATTSTNPFDNVQETNNSKSSSNSNNYNASHPMANDGVPGPAKPDFQRPVNEASSLVANGWIEQQRRSKMRLVWKEVLASLVQARKPGEETTLWIQREVVNPNTGKKELEALSQIPVKLLEKVTYLDYTPDNRFTLKLYNASEEFVFRCTTDLGAMNWVMALQRHEKLSKGKNPDDSTSKPSRPAFEEEQKGPENSNSMSNHRMGISELRAICHGAGINTAGMERSQLEAAAEHVRQRGTYFPPPANHMPSVPGHKVNPAPTARAHSPEPPSTGSAGSTSTSNISIHELRAICHGAGINTAGMERSQLEAAAEEVRKRGTYFPPPQLSHPQPPPSSGGVPSSEPAAPTEPQQQSAKISISELRAICHGAGINTAGMERRQLEAAAEEVRKRGTYFDPPPHSNHTSVPPSDDDGAKRREAEEKIRRAKEEYNRQKMEEEHRRMQMEEEQRRLQMEEEHRRQQMEEEHRRRMAEEEHRRRVAEQQAAEQRRRFAEEEHRRRVAEQEHQRRMAEQHAAEQQRLYAERQAQWQKQQQEEEQRRRHAEQQAAEQRRRHEEAVRKQQQWHQHQAQHQQQQQQWHHHHPQTQQQWHQQQQSHQQHHAPSSGPPPQQHHQPPPQQQQQQQQQQQHGQSPASQKYAKMANQSEDGGQAVITRIKHDILIHWALQPPQLQMLRPIDALVLNIHTVYPPALGVAGHDYFKKWKPVNRGDIVNDAGLPDEEKLKKAVRKIRFFLHPDKLPKDLNPEQAFMVKMLWDVTSDAWEEFEKRKADLDWIK